MRKQIFSVLAILLLLSIKSSYAQQDITEILKGGIGDATLIGKAYLEPFGNMFGTSLNGGWYQAARPHKKIGFNITVVAALTQAPASSKTFDVSELGLQSLQLKFPNDKLAPTITGEASPGPTLVLPNSMGEFDLPQGTGIPFLPLPMLQAGLGLPFSTEISFRFLPAVDLGQYGTLSLWGVGAKNQFKDFIPGLKKIPIDLSLFVGYTQFKYEYGIDYVPAGAPVQYDYSNQKLSLESSGYTARLLVGKTIPFISVYAGFGYSHAVTNFGLKGNYVVGVSPYSADDVYENPIMYDFPISTFSANIGARLRLGPISVNADYTLGNYPLYSLGVGLSIR
jgi:hypothetical protein